MCPSPTSSFINTRFPAMENNPVVRLNLMKRAAPVRSTQVKRSCPQKIVDYGGLDRQCRCDQVMKVQPCLQHNQHKDLDDKTHGADQVELDPASCDGTPWV